MFHHSYLLFWCHLWKGFIEWLDFDVLSQGAICDIVVLREHFVFPLIELFLIKVHAIAINVAVEGVDLVAYTPLINRLGIHIPHSWQVKSWILIHFVSLCKDDLFLTIPLHEQKVRIGTLDKWFHFPYVFRLSNLRSPKTISLTECSWFMSAAPLHEGDMWLWFQILSSFSAGATQSIILKVAAEHGCLFNIHRRS